MNSGDTFFFRRLHRSHLMLVACGLDRSDTVVIVPIETLHDSHEEYIALESGCHPFLTRRSTLVSGDARTLTAQDVHVLNDLNELEFQEPLAAELLGPLVDGMLQSERLHPRVKRAIQQARQSTPSAPAGQPRAT